MNITLHGFDIFRGNTFEWTVFDDCIVYKGKMIPLNSVHFVNYSPWREGAVNGTFSFHYGAKGKKREVLSFQASESQSANEVANFLSNILGSERFVDERKGPPESEKLRQSRATMFKQADKQLNMDIILRSRMAGEYFEVEIKDDRIICKDKTVYLNSLVLVEYNSCLTEDGWGAFTLYYGDDPYSSMFFNFIPVDRKYAKEVADFLLNFVGEERFIDIKKEPNSQKMKFVKESVQQRYQKAADRSNNLALIILIIVMTAFFASLIWLWPSVCGSSKSEWSQLSDEEQDQIIDNMDFYEEVKDAMDKYNRN